MSNFLMILLIAATLSGAVVIAEETVRASAEISKQEGGFVLNGKIRCVLVDDKIFCPPGTTRAPIKIKLAATTSN